MHIYVHIHTCYVFMEEGRDVEGNRDKIIRGKENQTRASGGKTVTVTTHANIQFMYTLAMHHRGISFSPVPEITFTSSSIHRIWLVKGRKYLKKFLLSISRECVLPWRKVRK